MANCLNTKNAQSISIGIIEVLIFLITTNFIIVPATKMAIRSLTNHASTKMNISVTIIKDPITAAILQIIIGLSEQQERISAKQRQRKMSENSIAPQQAQSVVSQRQVLMQTVANRKIGYKIAKIQPKRTGDILLYLILLQRTMKKIKAKHWVTITASKGRQMPQSCYFCQSLFTKYTILDSAEPPA